MRAAVFEQGERRVEGLASIKAWLALSFGLRRPCFPPGPIGELKVESAGDGITVALKIHFGFHLTRPTAVGKLVARNGRISPCRCRESVSSALGVLGSSHRVLRKLLTLCCPYPLAWGLRSTLPLLRIQRLLRFIRR